MISLYDLILKCNERLKNNDTLIPLWKLEEIISVVTGISRKSFLIKSTLKIPEQQVRDVHSRIDRLLKSEPIEHIVGHVEFLGNKITVTPDVLIPRPETEILADVIIKELDHSSGEEVVVWDVCCGSGCLGLSIARAYPKFAVTLSDISEKALSIAKGNAKDNKLTVNFLKGDLLQPFCQLKADVVVCNPPYISQFEYDGIDSSVKQFEPSLALVAKNNGYDFYKRLASDLPSHLNDSAKVFFEIGSTQAAGVKELFNSSCWSSVKCVKDYSGLDRFFLLEFCL